MSCIVSIVLGFRFFNCWAVSDKLLQVSLGNDTIKNIALFVVTLILIAGCILMLNKIFKVLIDSFSKTEDSLSIINTKTLAKEVVVIALTAVFCVTICSKSSPIYPLNNWDDANCFFTVGKSIVNDLVMYRDIFEQKGPLLYFLYSISYWISPSTFLGVYFLELITGFFFLLISYKTLCFFTKPNAIFFIPIVGLVIYSSSSFYFGGSAEEICLCTI